MPATPAWPPRSAPRLFVADAIARDAPITITGNQAHYLTRVMRVSTGDTIILCDDRTGEWACEAVVSKRTVVANAIEKLRPRERCPICGCALRF